MRITVIGAGTIGSAIAWDLAQRSDVSQVQVCDSRPGPLEKLHDHVRSPTLRTFQVNARDPQVLTPILKRSRCVVGCVTPRINGVLARMAVDLGIHFCDLGGNEEVVEEEFELQEEARKKSVWVVPNCGLAPGLINILCMHGVDQFDTVSDANVRVGDIPSDPTPPFNFHLSYDAAKLVEDYTRPATCIAQGELTRCQPLTGLEEINFSEPFNNLEAFHTSGGLSTLPSDLEGRVQNLDYKTIRYPGHAKQMRFLLALGFAEERAVDVRTHLTYRDILVRRLEKRLRLEEPDVVVLRILISGTKEGEKKTLVYEMIDYSDQEQHLTAMQRCTGFPVSVIASLLASKSVPGGGVSPPEHIVPKENFFDTLLERGLDLNVNWYDGQLDVTAPLPDYQNA